MKKKEEWKYLNKQWKKMRKQFKNFIRSQSPEALHHFRVQVKKINSFLMLLEINKENDALKKTFKPVKKIFKSAGIIRNAFIHQKQAKEHHINMPQLLKEQHALQENETNNFLSGQSNHLHKMKKAKKKLHDRLHAITSDEIKSFYTAQLYNTQQLLNRHRFDEQLHNGRKMLKHLLYNKPVLQNGLAKKINIDFDFIDQLQQALGDWHDNKLALAFFSDKIAAGDLEPMNRKNRALQKAITVKAKAFTEKAKA